MDPVDRAIGSAAELLAAAQQQKSEQEQQVEHVLEQRLAGKFDVQEFAQFAPLPSQYSVRDVLRAANAPAVVIALDPLQHTYLLVNRLAGTMITAAHEQALPQGGTIHFGFSAFFDSAAAIYQGDMAQMPWLPPIQLQSLEMQIAAAEAEEEARTLGKRSREEPTAKLPIGLLPNVRTVFTDRYTRALLDGTAMAPLVVLGENDAIQLLGMYMVDHPIAGGVPAHEVPEVAAFRQRVVAQQLAAYANQAPLPPPDADLLRWAAPMMSDQNRARLVSALKHHAVAAIETYLGAKAMN